MSDKGVPQRDYSAEIAEARRVALEGMKAFEKAAWTHGFHQGFSAGWEAGRKRLQEVMEQATAQPEPASARPQQPADLALFPAEAASPGLKAAEIVFRIIAEQPGIRGIDIVKTSAEVGSPLLERTTRTALYRMKRDGRIKNLEGRWYAADATPASADDNSGGENDG